MKTVQIPKTDLKVSRICLGTMTFGTPVGEDQAIKLVHYAYDKGVNFIDTANMYEGYARHIGSAGGVAEKIIGKAVAGRRKDFILATKLGMKVGDAPEDEGTSPEAIKKHLDMSLKRMQTDFVDIYYLHKPDESTPTVEILQALQQAIKSGKVRYYGISNYSADQTAALLKVADENSLPRPVIHQPGMSYLKQDAVADLLPLCKKENIAVAPYQVLQGGLLTGKYKRDQAVPADSRKAEKQGWVPDLDDALFDKTERFEAEAKKANLSMTQYAIRWVLDQPAVVSAIVGIKRAEQLEEAITAAKE